MFDYKELIKKRNRLLSKAMNIKRNAFDVPLEQSIELRKKQDELWKQYLFYQNLIKKLDNGKKR